MNFEFFILALNLIEQLADFVFVEFTRLGHVHLVPWIFDIIAEFSEFRTETLSHGEAYHASHIPRVPVAPAITFDD